MNEKQITHTPELLRENESLKAAQKYDSYFLQMHIAYEKQLREELESYRRWFQMVGKWEKAEDVQTAVAVKLEAISKAKEKTI